MVFDVQAMCYPAKAERKHNETAICFVSRGRKLWSTTGSAPLPDDYNRLCFISLGEGAMSGALLPGVRLRADCAPPRPTLRDRRPFVLWNQSMTRSAPLPLLRTPALTRWDLVTLRYAATATSIRSTCTCSGLGRSSRPTPWASCAPPTPAKDRCEQG